MSGALFDKSIDVLSTSLDLYLLRHSVITDNVANAETPYFKARRVDFEQELQRVMDMQDQGFSVEKGLQSVTPKVYQDAESETGQDLNTVDMDREMAALAKNEVKYSAATQAIGKKFALLKYAMSEGGER